MIDARALALLLFSAVFSTGSVSAAGSPGASDSLGGWFDFANLGPWEWTGPMLANHRVVHGTKEDDVYIHRSVEGQAGLEGDRPFFIVGRGGDDFISGTPYDDVLYGGGGRDVLEGRGGNDYLHGGLGRDMINGGEGNDLIFGGTGRDALTDDFTGVSDSSEEPGYGNDIIFGGRGNDMINVFGGRDFLSGGLHDDGYDFFGPGHHVIVASDFRTNAIGGDSIRTQGVADRDFRAERIGIDSVRMPSFSGLTLARGAFGADAWRVSNGDGLTLDFVWLPGEAAVAPHVSWFDMVYGEVTVTVAGGSEGE